MSEISALRAEEPGETAELRDADAENVSAQVTSQVKDFPSLYGKTVTPSGLLLASKSRPEGSRIELKPATFKAQNTCRLKHNDEDNDLCF